MFRSERMENVTPLPFSITQNGTGPLCEQFPSVIRCLVVLDQDWYTTNGGGFGNVAEGFVQEVSWVRLREVSLSYTVPSKVFEKTPISGLNFGVSGRNLLLITPYEGVDPETNLMGSVNAQGMDYFNMPNTRTFSARLGITF